MSGVQQRKSAIEAASLLEEPHFLEELAGAAAEAGKNDEQARKYAHKCLTEIAARPTDSWFRPAARLARFIYTRNYEPQLDINLSALDELRSLSRDNLLLFVWSHKSHMDSFVFLLSLFDNGFRPMPLVFAGINMNFLGFGALARRAGAIFLRRKFQDDPIYKLVFRHYIDFLIRNRLPLTWSIEGTRSRTGKMSLPKLGILNWVLEACERQDMRDTKLVPVSIAFDRIAEIDDYVSLQRGVPKRKESLSWFLDYVFGRKEPHGKIYVRFADPVDIREVAGTGPLTTCREGPSLAMRLAFEVCHRIEEVTPIKSADVLAMVLLGADDRALSGEEIFHRASEIEEMARERGFPLARSFSLDDEEEVAATLLAMRGSKLVREFSKGSTPVYYIPEEQQLAAAYYRNTITHYFLAAALGEIALALGDDDAGGTREEQLRRRVGGLLDLLKFEFFFPPREKCFQAVQREVADRYPQWDSDAVPLSGQLEAAPPRFGHAILRSIAEAYHVVATTLCALGATPINDKKAFTRSLLNQGREMLLRKQISGESAISRELFSTALQLAEHRQLLVEGTDNLESRRAEFAMETRRVLHAINLLQRSSDQAWIDSVALAAHHGNSTAQ